MPRPRWWELAPEAAVAAGLGWFALSEASAARSAFASSTAVALMAATAVGWVAARVVAARLLPWAAARVAVFAAAALGILAVVVLPAYDDTTVVESLPVAATVPTQAPEPDAPTTSVPVTTPSQPVAVAVAPLHGIDHRASGTVRLYEAADGSQFVGLEDIDIQPGPDYDVYVVPGADAESPDGGVRLDDLRGNRGTQYYAVPAGTDVTSGPWTVLVWCQLFDVPVAGATPT